MNRTGILAVAAVGGAGTMTVELAAVRLLAPWFGTSQAVWTNVIGVVLLALALGYVIGGRLSAGPRPLATLGQLLFLAGLATSLLPLAAGPLAALFLPADLRLHEAAGAIVWGSLAASLTLFLLPAALLGCVAPLAVESLQRSLGGAAGRAGGAVLGASTLGSLAGVFGTSHVLVPGLGLRGTYLVAAIALGLAGAIALWLARRDGRGGGLGIAAGSVGIAAVLSGLGGEPRSLGPNRIELARAESPYQLVRVVEQGRGDERLRFLQVNEGFDSYQSVWQPEPGPLPLGFYYDDFALPPVLAHRGDRWRVLVLGVGGGTAIRVLEGVLDPGQLEVVGVELDPVVVELAREFMDLPAEGTPGVEVATGLDARVALGTLEREFDQVVIDCYSNQVEIPAHLTTVEFFREVKSKLAPGGWLQVNLGGFGFDDPVVDAVSRTAAVAFEDDVELLRVPFSRNFTLVARRDAPLPDFEGLPLEPGLEPELVELLRARELPTHRRRVTPSAAGDVLTDDRAPVEILQQRSIEQGASRLRGESG